MKMTTRRTFILILFLGLFFMTLRPIADPDFWWHLKTGELIFHSHSIPYSDPFSFPKMGAHWITHEWLTELLMYSIFIVGGYGSLIFLFSLIITGAFLVTYLRCSAETKPYIAGFVLLVGAIATAPTWGVRPQMISLLFTSVFLYLLDRHCQKNSYMELLPLPILTLVWVNLHAGYLLGLAIIGLHIVGRLVGILIGELINRTRKENIHPLYPILSLCVCFGLCLLATLVNPNGIQILIYPFQTLTSPSMQKLIQEWFSPDFHQLIWQPLAFFFMALIGIGMISKKTITFENVLLSVVFGYAALRSMRNIPIFILVTIPILSEQLNSLISIPIEKQVGSRSLRWIMPILLLTVFSLLGARFIEVIHDQARNEAETFPKAAVDWLIENKQHENVFNTYGWGGYLIWRTFPQYRVYIDGRADVYGDDYIYDYIAIYRANQGWEKQLIDQKIQTVIIEADSPLANMMKQSHLWQIAFVDNNSIIFTR
jgi:hypothetical protein